MNSRQSNKRSCDSAIRGYGKVKRAAPNEKYPSLTQFRGSAMLQEFPLPLPIMRYIWGKPSSPEVYQKLIKSCKLFFLKNPILVINNLNYISSDGWQYCNSSKCEDLYCKHKHQKIDKFIDKIWISNKFNVFNDEQPNFASAFIPKIFLCNVKKLSFHHQNLSYDALQFLSSGVKECHLHYCTVKYGSALLVPLENIIKLFSGCKHFFMDFSKEKNNAECKNYNDLIKTCQTITKMVELYWIPATVFDIPTFYKHLKSNKNRARIGILFSEGPKRVFEVIDEILASESFDFVPPVIKHLRFDRNKIIKMEEIQASEVAKYH